MQTQRIVLASNTRLMRDLLRRVIERTPGLRIVGEVGQRSRLAAAIESRRPEWVVISLQSGGRVPEDVKWMMTAFPQTRFLAVSMDGSQVRMKWQAEHEVRLDDLTLPDLIAVLRGDQVPEM